jgi:hypothetical protein
MIKGKAMARPMRVTVQKIDTPIHILCFRKVLFGGAYSATYAAYDIMVNYYIAYFFLLTPCHEILKSNHMKALRRQCFRVYNDNLLACRQIKLF